MDTMQDHINEARKSYLGATEAGFFKWFYLEYGFYIPQNNRMLVDFLVSVYWQDYLDLLEATRP